MYLTNENIGDFIRGYRVIDGMSQRELADKAGVARSTLALYESGKRVPDLSTTARILEALGVRYGFFGNKD